MYNDIIFIIVLRIILGGVMKTVITDDKLTLNDGRVISLDNSFVLPAFADVHVHFREPGYEYKETIKTGCLSGAAGGYTDVCTMPNLKPAPSNLDALKVQLDIIKRDANIGVHPYGTITEEGRGEGRMADMEAVAPYVIAFTDDGFGVQDGGQMREAMQRARALDKMIVAHCEDMDLLHQGKVAESEWRQIERDLKLADETKVAYHVCHISCKESVEVIREAKKSGVNVTCETAPHYLVLDRNDLDSFVTKSPELGGRFKMNPPIKDAADREALIEGIHDGTVDMIATDHAPHADDEKNRGFLKSMNGIVGLETAFPVLYTRLVKTGIISLDKLVDLMSINPRERFGLAAPDDYVVIDYANEYVINPDSFKSNGRWTPFDGWKVYGRPIYTIRNGEVVYG